MFPLKGPEWKGSSAFSETQSEAYEKSHADGSADTVSRPFARPLDHAESESVFKRRWDVARSARHVSATSTPKQEWKLDLEPAYQTEAIINKIHLSVCSSGFWL